MYVILSLAWLGAGLTLRPVLDQWVWDRKLGKDIRNHAMTPISSEYPRPNVRIIVQVSED